MSFQVYRLRHDNRYQYMLPHHQIELDCRPQEGGWVPPSMEIPEPLLDRGNFFNGERHYFIVEKEGLYALAPHFEAVGEILPVLYEEEDFFLINILACEARLAIDKSDWGYGIGVKHYPYGIPKKYSFREDKLPLGMYRLFKIPETHMVEILLCEDDEEDKTFSFRTLYNQYKLTGLIFQKIWDSSEDE